MGVLLRCVGVLAVLWFGPAAGYFEQRFRRQDAGSCVTCAGAECEKAEKTSACPGLYAVEADGPEKELANKLAGTLGADNIVPEKLTNCYTLTFKAGDKEGEFRDCGPDDVCGLLEKGKADLGIEVTKCEACAKAATPCNGPKKEAEPTKVTTVETLTTKGSEVVSEVPEEPEMSEAPTEAEVGTTATTASPDSEETSGTRAFKILSNSVYLMWVTSVVLLFRLE